MKECKVLDIERKDFLKSNTFFSKVLIYMEILMPIIFEISLKSFIFMELRLLFGPFGI